MKYLIKLEEMFLFGVSIYLFTKLDFSWWWFPVFIFVPDLSMLGYAISPQVGAWTYNLIHHKALGITIYIFGLFLLNPALQFAGLILFAHSSMDRVMGYGLKFSDSFQHTHLGLIGKPETQK